MWSSKLWLGGDGDGWYGRGYTKDFRFLMAELGLFWRSVMQHRAFIFTCLIGVFQYSIAMNVRML